VQRDGRDLLAHVIENMLIGHGDLPVLAVIVRDDALLLNMSSDV
jgi:hypothetical protein